MQTSRTRVQDDRHIEYRTYRYTDGVNPIVTEVTPRGSSGRYSSISDNNNRGFAKLSKRGMIILSDCSLVRMNTVFRPGSLHRAVSSTGWSGSQIGDFRTWMQGAPSPPAETGIVLPSSDQLFITAFARMNSSELMAGEAVSDLGQTVAMLRSPFRGATDLLNRMFKSRAAHAKKTAKSVAQATAGTWLEYRYGWRPLLSDIDIIAQDALVKRGHCERHKLVARAGRGGSQDWSGSWKPTDAIDRAGSISMKRTSSRNVGVVYEVKNRTSQDVIRKLYGLRVRDVPATLWELVPYSFVIDWFTNVGDWIQAISPDPFISVVGTWTTYVTNSVYSIDGSIAYKDQSRAVDNWTGSLGGETITSFEFHREANPEITLTPSVTAKTLSRLHQADAMALLLKPILGSLASFRH